MASIASISLRLAKRVTTVRQSTATGADATYISDSNLSGMGQYEGGVLWFLSGTHADKMRDILANPKDKFTFATLTTTPGTARYALADKLAGGKDLLMSAINEGLRQVKPRLTEDDSSLTVDGDVQVYTLPAGVSDLTKVEIATSLTAPYYYYESRHWVEVDGELRFANGWEPVNDGYKMNLTYRAAHADETDESADLELTAKQEEGVFWKALDEYAGYLLSLRPNGDDAQRVTDAKNEALVRWGQYTSKHTIPQRNSKLASW